MAERVGPGVAVLGAVGELARTAGVDDDDEGPAHAYLFTGPRGTGKTSVARILYRAANCTHAVPLPDSFWNTTPAPPKSPAPSFFCNPTETSTSAVLAM